MPPTPPLHSTVFIQPCTFSPSDLPTSHLSTDLSTVVEQRVEQPSPTIPPTIQIDFSDLRLFEQVEQQYLDQGIEMEGAIAIQPSNPAFQTDRLAIMPNAERSDITVRFHVPRHHIQAVVTGVKAIKLTAFDAKQQILAQHCVGVAQYLQLLQLPATDSQDKLPQQQLDMAIENQSIYQIQVSSDAPFVLHQLVIA